MRRERRYEIIEQIGAGGMAEVFRARAVGLFADRRHVAIKRLFTHSRPDMVEALLREAAFGRELAHPRIVEILGWHLDPEGRVCLVMELVEGMDLAHAMGATLFPLDAALYVVRTVLKGLVHVHETAKLVHRDVTPHNILVSWDGDVKLSDFGIAKRAMSEPTTGGVRGKLHYLSPEQMLRRPTDGRADLFAVGVLLYMFATGDSPFGTASEGEIVAALLSGSPIQSPREVGADISVELDSAIMKLLAFRREDRYASAREALAALPTTPDGRKVLATLMCTLQQRDGANGLSEFAAERPVPLRWQRHRRALASIAGLSLAGLITGGLWSSWRSESTPSARAHVAPVVPDAMPIVRTLSEPPVTPERLLPMAPGARNDEPPSSVTTIDRVDDKANARPHRPWKRNAHKSDEGHNRGDRRQALTVPSKRTFTVPGRGFSFDVQGK